MFSGFLAHAWLCLLYSSGPPAQRTVLLTVDWVLLCQLVIKRIGADMSVGQSVLRNSSAR